VAGGFSNGYDPLADAAGVVASVRMWEDGRARQVTGLDASVASDTGHFIASVGMVLDTLVRTWSDIVAMQAAPLRAWALRSGRYWLVGTGDRAWVLKPEETDLAAVLRMLDL
jgi:roadblock/LC7 domain-containing protein